MQSVLGCIRRCCLALFLAGPMTLGCGAVQAAQRYALVISNSSYQHTSQLRNPQADAALIAATLGRLNFEVTTRFDLNAADMRREIRDFGNKISDNRAEWAVVYYAGHGMEVEGENYLIPVDAELVSDRNINDDGYQLREVLNKIKSASRLRLVILDACRNNPFPKMVRSRSTRAHGVGLAAIPESALLPDYLIAFSAKDGATAQDGEGENSPFAQALAEQVERPGVEVELMLRRVRDRVAELTNGEQESWKYGSLPGTELYFSEPQTWMERMTGKKPASGAGGSDPALAQPAPAAPVPHQPVKLPAHTKRSLRTLGILNVEC